MAKPPVKTNTPLKTPRPVPNSPTPRITPMGLLRFWWLGLIILAGLAGLVYFIFIRSDHGQKAETATKIEDCSTLPGDQWINCTNTTVTTRFAVTTCLNQKPYGDHPQADQLANQTSICWRAYAINGIEPTACDNVAGDSGKTCWGEVAKRKPLADGMTICDRLTDASVQASCFGTLVSANAKNNADLRRICDVVGTKRLDQEGFNAVKEACK